MAYSATQQRSSSVFNLYEIVSAYITRTTKSVVFLFVPGPKQKEKQTIVRGNYELSFDPNDFSPEFRASLEKITRNYQGGNTVDSKVE